MFVTLLMCIVDARAGRVEWCSAGHAAPYVVAPDGTVNQIKSRGSIPVGVLEALLCVSGTIALAPGESVFLYTDGVTEAANGSEELFGDERLAAALRATAGGSPDAIVHAVLHAVREFAGLTAQSDDIAALACRWNG
jgi:sigma-B regulation protein RsbU (phosphoserine phosphatase)